MLSVLADRLRQWLRYVRPGDGLILCAALGIVVASAWRFWSSDTPQMAIVRLDGKIVARAALDRPRMLTVRGPLGTTQIEVQAGRARIVSDPGPRQYCVRQGWLSRADAIAICAPSHLSLSLQGRESRYDTLGY